MARRASQMGEFDNEIERWGEVDVPYLPSQLICSSGNDIKPLKTFDFGAPCQNNAAKCNKFKILHQNSQAATNKIDCLNLMADEVMPEVMVITEHHFNECNIHQFRLENYYLSNNFARSNFKGGGIALFVKKGIQYESGCNVNCSEKDFEAASISLLMQKNKMFLIGLYRSPDATTATAIDNVITNIPSVAVSLIVTAISDHDAQLVTLTDFAPVTLPPQTVVSRATRPENIAAFFECCRTVSRCAPLVEYEWQAAPAVNRVGLFLTNMQHSYPTRPANVIMFNSLNTN
ncbi:hypothetical protein J6590_091907 [Homalodisca vitripennis]|nr:hypothetical protein J6590_091907 [Homalodisca vitripennis]